MGSLIKPMVYLEALQSGRYDLASVVRDVTPAPGRPNPLSANTIEDIRDCFALISAVDAKKKAERHALLSVADAVEFYDRLRLDGPRAAVGAPILKEIGARGMMERVVRHNDYARRLAERVEKEENLELLARFFAPLTSLPFDDRCAEEYGALRAQADTSLRTTDLMTAATARAHDAVLVTPHRAAFRRLTGLRLADWPDEAA